MRIYFGKDKQNATQVITATHMLIRSLTRRVVVVHKFYMDNFFFSPHLFDGLHTRGINCYGTLRHKCKGIPL
jgi:hypothetical protein